MALWVIFLLLIGNGLRGSAMEVHDDLQNDVNSLQVQGYEVHEELSDHSRESSPHLETTVRRLSSAGGQGSTGASESGEQHSSADRTTGVYLKSSKGGELTNHSRVDKLDPLTTSVLRHRFAGQGQGSTGASESGEQHSSAARTTGVYLQSSEDGELTDHSRVDKLDPLTTSVLRHRFAGQGQGSTGASEPGEQESSTGRTTGVYLQSSEDGELTDHSRVNKLDPLTTSVLRHRFAGQGQGLTSASKPGGQDSSTARTTGVYLQSSEDGELTDHSRVDKLDPLTTSVLRHRFAGQGQGSTSASEPREQDSSTARIMGFYQPAGEDDELANHSRDEELPLYGTSVLRHSSADQGQGSSIASGPGEQNYSAGHTNGINQPFGEAKTIGNYEAGKEIVNIINKKINVHATPERSALTDSIKYSIGDDATFTHKPIIVRSLTLSELDKSNRDHISSKRYNNLAELPGDLKHHEEKLRNNLPDISKTQNNINPFRKEYKEIVRRPFHYYKSYVSQDESGFNVERDSLAQKIDDGTSDLQSSNPPRILTHYPQPSRFGKDDTFEVGTEKKVHGVEESSRVAKNQEENSFSTIPTYEQSTSSVKHVDRTDSGDGGISTPYQNQFILDQSHYPIGSDELIFNQNRFSYPFVPEQFNIENYRLRFPYPIQSQQNLHHIDHSVSSSAEKGTNVNEHDQVDFRRGILNSDTINTSQYGFLPPHAGSVEHSFGGFPFIGPLCLHFHLSQ